jgi:hypothetical protein
MNVPFPFGGLKRSLAFQSQEPMSAYDMRNAIPESTEDGRMRGGMRPCQVRLFNTSSSSPIRMLSTVTIKKPGSTFAFLTDYFDYEEFGSYWGTSIAGLTSTSPTILNGLAIGNKGDSTEQKALVHTAMSDLKSGSTSDTYRIGLYVLPYQNAHHGQYSIYFRMASSPNISSSLEARMTITGTGTVSIALYKDGSGTPLATWTPTADPFCTEGWFEVLWTKGASNDTVEAFWRGASVGSTSSSTGTGTDNRWGFGMKATTSGGRVIVDRVRIQYNKTSTYELLRPITVFVQNGQIFRDATWFGAFAASGSSLRCAADRTLQCAERGQKLYIADHSEPIASGTDGVVSTANTFDSATYTDWTAVLSNTPGDANYYGDYVVHVTAPDDKAGVYPISGLSSSSLTIYAHVDSDGAPVAAGATNGTGLSFRIERGPKIYDPSADTLSPWVTRSGRGIVPCGCAAVSNFGDVMMLAVDPLDPNQYYGSRLSDPHDFLMTDDDVGAAFEGGSGEAAKTGDAITSLMYQTDDLMLIGCRSSLYLMSGTPAAAGAVQVVSHTIGCHSNLSFSRGPQGEVLYLSNDGFYLASPQCMKCEPKPISRENLPRELLGINPSVVVTTAYDVWNRGSWLFLTPLDDIDDVIHWYFDWPNKALFPVTFPKAAMPTCCCWLNSPDVRSSALLMGGKDGSIYMLSWTAANDSLGTVDSYAQYGPFSLGEGMKDGSLKKVKFWMGEDSGDTTLKVYVARSAEAAAKATTPARTANLGSGEQHTIYVKARGRAYRMDLEGTPGERWATEHCDVETALLGTSR